MPPFGCGLAVGEVISSSADFDRYPQVPWVRCFMCLYSDAGCIWLLGVAVFRWRGHWRRPGEHGKSADT